MNVCKTHSLCSQTPVSQASRQWKWNPSVVSDSWRPHGLQPKRLLCPWDFPGENTGVDCHFLLQEIFPTKRIKPGSPALWADALPSEPPGNQTENPKDLVKKLLELTNSLKFHNIKWIPKILLFLYNNNKVSEIKIKKAVPLTMHQK